MRLRKADFTTIDELEDELDILVGNLAEYDSHIGGGDLQEDLTKVLGAGRQHHTMSFEAPALTPEACVHQVTPIPQRLERRGDGRWEIVPLESQTRGVHLVAVICLSNKLSVGSKLKACQEKKGQVSLLASSRTVRGKQVIIVRD